ncbi:SDR family oxidoreductase [Crocinitomicaceae bacterium CZZ-1]|uniref:SDR family oxidoreductase n=1 Tax=Taishania pollutisoli TaxID=2766479 RepID=A0A8J6TSJ9_9FLAO|nr:SDR family oxidoreductase [Taishania pollutisoli]MBC9812307.1 SDR family oxidoreductase [Taishania pollutisoli]NGF74292.1 SDR family oxidoreductase [Fluviicola sp. SGL-29]
MSKTVVVVGASRGIGKAMVDLFAKDPSVTIYALARDEEKMRKEFAAHSNVHCKPYDLSVDDCADQLEHLLAKVEHIDVLINNAGYLVNKPFEELSHRDFARSYQVNVIGVMQTVQALLPKMERGAHIVNISSMGGFQGTVKFPGLAAYSTSKAALVSFTELFAEEFKHTEIKMNCLCLGAVQTEMLHEAFPGYEAQISPEQMAAYICNFALTAHQWMHGRVIPVSLTTP